MSMGFEPFVIVMPVTAQQRQRLESGDATGPREEIWAECVKVIEQKKTPAVAEYRHFGSVKGDDIPHHKGVVPGCVAQSEFMEFYGLGTLTQRQNKLMHVGELLQHGVPVPAGVIIEPLTDDVAAEHGGWMIRYQLGRIDCDTGFYDGEKLKTQTTPARDMEILSRMDNYALCILELYGEKDIKHEG